MGAVSPLRPRLLRVHPAGRDASGGAGATGRQKGRRSGCFLVAGHRLPTGFSPAPPAPPVFSLPGARASVSRCGAFSRSSGRCNGSRDSFSKGLELSNQCNFRRGPSIVYISSFFDVYCLFPWDFSSALPIFASSIRLATYSVIHGVRLKEHICLLVQVRYPSLIAIIIFFLIRQTTSGIIAFSSTTRCPHKNKRSVSCSTWYGSATTCVPKFQGAVILTAP